MSREIKFRAKGIASDNFIYSNGYYHDGINYWFIFPKEDSKAIAFSKKVTIDIDTLSQFTGLYDKNGVEIFEGDIVFQHEGGIHFAKDHYDSCVVTQSKYGWSPFGDMIGNKAHDFKGNIFEYIVMGNVYENPNLLEELK